MEKIKLTPESVKRFAVLSQEPRITISRTMVSFNPAAAARLALKEGSLFVLEIEAGKLIYKDTVEDSGFKITNTTKQKTLNAYASGIAQALYANKVTLEPKTTRFTIGGFNEGRWELVVTKKKGGNDVPKP